MGKKVRYTTVIEKDMTIDDTMRLESRTGLSMNNIVIAHRLAKDRGEARILLHEIFENPSPELKKAIISEVKKQLDTGKIQFL